MRAVLGIDTSCYTTSCAAADEQFNLLSADRMLLPVKQGTCGLRQSEAVFIHLKQLPQVMEETLSHVNADIAAVCVSTKPTDGNDSYMPVFQADCRQQSLLRLLCMCPAMKQRTSVVI